MVSLRPRGYIQQLLSGLCAEFEAYLKKVIAIINCVDARLKVKLRYLKNLK